MNLAASIRLTKISTGSLTLWWLGQSGFLLKSPSGHVLAIDPYLTNSCAAVGKKFGLRMDRLMPAPIAPSELDCDLFAFTHSHPDHLDLETLAEYRAAGRNGPYLAPPETQQKLVEFGITHDRIEVTWPNNTRRLGDLTIRTVLAIPMCEDDLNHVGFIVTVDGGPCVYFTGDTSYHEILAIQARPSKPHALVTIINGAFRNMSPYDAARLARELNVEKVIPCHYGMFADNTVSPELLRTNLFMEGIADRYCELKCGEAFNLRANKKRHPMDDWIGFGS